MVKFRQILALMAIIFAFSTTAKGAVAVTPTSSMIIADGAEKSFEAYNINGSNYFKLRDLAFTLNGTNKQFEVGYDDATKTVTLTTGKGYSAVGGEMSLSGGGSKNAVQTQTLLAVDGSRLSLTAYNIEGSNYFKLRDIAEAVNCAVTYDAATGIIGIDTSAGYTAPAAAPPLASSGQTSAEKPGNIVTENPTIGGGRANFVYIPLGGSRKLEIVTANGNVASDENAQNLIKRGQGKLVAAINGGFFASYYNAGKTIAFPDNYPGIYGAVVKNGRVINGGGVTNALGIAEDGKPLIDSVDIKTKVNVKKPDGDRGFTVWGVNKYYDDADSINMFTPEFTLQFTTKPDSKVVSVKDGAVVSVADGGSYTVPAGTNVVVFNSGAVANAMQWESFPAVGDKADITTEFIPKKSGSDWSGVKTIGAGGRMLLQNGYVVTDDAEYNETVNKDPKQASGSKAQRSFAAVMSDGRLVLGTANASFNEIANYLKSKNAIDAVSMDGGASSMLYADGKGFLTNAGRKLAVAFVVTE